MKTNSTSAEALLLLVMLAPFIYLVAVWNQLPAQIATHFDLRGNPNDWQSKGTAAILLGGLSVLMYVVFRFLPAVDPRGRLQSSNYQKLRFVVTLFLSAAIGWLWFVAAHHPSKGTSMVVILMGVSLLLAGIGNYITTVKPNWFVGIRTPWTLENETVWRKTHQMGGRLMVAGGLLGALLVFIVPEQYAAGVVIGITFVTSIIPVVYSYIYYRQEKARQFN